MERAASLKQCTWFNVGGEVERALKRLEELNDSKVSFLEAKKTTEDQRMQCSLLRTYFLEAAVLIDPMEAAVGEGEIAWCVGMKRMILPLLFPKTLFVCPRRV